MNLVGKIIAVHTSLERAGIDHAFGGALALAWCTQQARGTIDIDVNIFVDVDEAPGALAALPADVTVGETDLARIAADGQTRLWWGQTPVDVFLNTTDFHRAAATRTSTESFAGSEVPFLACRDLAVFKAFFNRTKDWADLEAMHDAGTLDIEAILGVLVLHLGGDDERVRRLRELAAPA